MLYDVLINSNVVGRVYAWERPVSLDVQMQLVTDRVSEFVWQAHEYHAAA